METRITTFLGLLCACVAYAEPKTVAIAVGDCRNAELLQSAQSFSDAVSKLLKTDALEPAEVLDHVKPLSTTGLDDVQRQLDAAQSQFYDGQADRALESVKSTLEALYRLAPAEAVTQKVISARLLEGLIWRGLGRKAEQSDAWREALRIAPAYTLDPDFHSPSAIAQFEALKKSLDKVKRVHLSVTSTPSGATVFVDGAAVGKTPLKNAGLFAGAHRVVLRHGDATSFARDIKLEKRPVELAVDMATEGILSTQLPLCVVGGESEALKVAARLEVEQAVVLKVESRRSEPGWVSVVLFDVHKGTRVRDGGMKVAAAKLGRGYADLASFVLTGKPELPSINAPVATTAAPNPSSNDSSELEFPTLKMSAPSKPLPRWVPWVVSGTGVALAASGLGYWLSGSADRRMLGSHLTSNGEVIAVTPEQGELVKAADSRVSSNNYISLGLGIGGGVVTALGAALYFLFPKEIPVEPVAWLTPKGGMLGFTMDLK